LTAKRALYIYCHSVNYARLQLGYSLNPKSQNGLVKVAHMTWFIKVTKSVSDPI